MSTITIPAQPVAPIRQAPGFIRRCLDALQARRKRARIRAALYGLSNHELKDIGIAFDAIEYVAANPDIDPRGS